MMASRRRLLLSMLLLVSSVANHELEEGSEADVEYFGSDLEAGTAEALECRIDRLSELGPDEFDRRYRGARLPVIVQTSVAGFGLAGPEELSERYGSLTVTAGASYARRSRGTHRMRLSAFLAKDESAGWQQGLDYVLDVSTAHSEEGVKSGLRELFSPPPFLVSESFWAIAGVVRPWEYLILGHSGAGSPDHWHGDFFNLLIYGEKKWNIEGPNGERRSACMQRPGEVVYLPRGWYHAVHSLTETFGIAVQRREMPFTWGHALSLGLCLFLLLRRRRESGAADKSKEVGEKEGRGKKKEAGKKKKKS